MREKNWDGQNVWAQCKLKCGIVSVDYLCKGELHNSLFHVPFAKLNSCDSF